MNLVCKFHLNPGMKSSQFHDGPKNTEVLRSQDTMSFITRRNHQKTPAGTLWIEPPCERFITSCSRGPAGPEIPQLLILAGTIGLPATQEAIPFLMASPHVGPAACCCWILWSRCSHILFAVQGGTFFSGDVSTLFSFCWAGKPGVFKWFA